MSRPLSLSAVALLAAALVALGAHAAAGQTTPSIPGSPGTTGVKIDGSTVVRLDPILLATLEPSGARVRAGKPAKKTKTGAKFKVSAVSLGRDGVTYQLKHKGEMRISTRRRSLRMKNPTATVDPTTGQGDFIATVKGKRRKLARLQIDIGALEQTGSGITADNVTMTMTARLAKELNSLLGVNALLEGTTFARASVRVITEP